MTGDVSPWRHVLCAACWSVLNPRRRAWRIVDAPETCCQCGQVTRDGIFWRADPRGMECRGAHIKAQCGHVAADPTTEGWTVCHKCGAHIKADPHTGLLKAVGE